MRRQYFPGLPVTNDAAFFVLRFRTFRKKTYDQFPLARPVEFNQHDSLPRAQDNFSTFTRNPDRCSDQCRQNVIGHVRRIVRMAVAQFRNHGFERVEHVEICARIEIRCGQSGCGMKYKKIAGPGGLRVILLDESLDRTGDIEDFAFLAGLDLDSLHTSELLCRDC